MDLDILRVKIVLIIERDMVLLSSLHYWAEAGIDLENEFILGVAAAELSFITLFF